ncbi:hypothetical protein [Pseudoduganella sp. OTU4001]|uniref:hypothetical protein n=1 Tax=Pseudoduganella sp. OTU4001 TaxID=3043854 RepID=UPI00313E34BA
MNEDKGYHRGEIYLLEKVRIGSMWTASLETCGGTKLSEVAAPNDDLAKVRFSHDVFEVLRKKRRKGETVREAIERIILAAPNN